MPIQQKLTPPVVHFSDFAGWENKVCLEENGTLRVAQKHNNQHVWLQCLWRFIIDIKIITVLQKIYH